MKSIQETKRSAPADLIKVECRFRSSCSHSCCVCVVCLLHSDGDYTNAWLRNTSVLNWRFTTFQFTSRLQTDGRRLYSIHINHESATYVSQRCSSIQENTWFIAFFLFLSWVCVFCPQYLHSTHSRSIEISWTVVMNNNESRDQFLIHVTKSLKDECVYAFWVRVFSASRWSLCIYIHSHTHTHTHSHSICRSSTNTPRIMNTVVRTESLSIGRRTHLWVSQAASNRNQSFNTRARTKGWH